VTTNPATITDLTARALRPLTDVEKTWGEQRLADAFDQIVTRVPAVATRLDATPADERFTRLVVQVECAMVLRVLNNPDGKLEEQGDDYSYRLDQAVSTGALYLSDAEAALLASGDGSSDGAFTIKPAGSRYSGTWLTPDEWIPA
jgi:hypothetical protein